LFFGNLLVQAGKLDEGLQELEISRDLEPNSSHVRFALAQLYRRLNRNDDALREQKAFERLKPFEEPGLPFGQAVGSPSAPSKPASAEKSPTGSSN
jgi:predicted Zn-dependent protease